MTNSSNSLLARNKSSCLALRSVLPAPSSPISALCSPLLLALRSPLSAPLLFSATPSGILYTCSNDSMRALSDLLAQTSPRGARRLGRRGGMRRSFRKLQAACGHRAASPVLRETGSLLPGGCPGTRMALGRDRIGSRPSGQRARCAGTAPVGRRVALPSASKSRRAASASGGRPALGNAASVHARRAPSVFLKLIAVSY